MMNGYKLRTENANCCYFTQEYDWKIEYLISCIAFSYFLSPGQKPRIS